MLWTHARSVEIICRRGWLVYQLPLLQEAPKGIRQLKLLLSEKDLQSLRASEPSELVWRLERGEVRQSVESFGSARPPEAVVPDVVQMQ